MLDDYLRPPLKRAARCGKRVAAGSLITVALSSLLAAGCGDLSEARPVVIEEHCEVDPFSGAERVFGEVRNDGKPGHVAVEAIVELEGGEHREATTYLGEVRAGGQRRFLLQVGVPEGAHVVGCQARARGSVE